MANQLLKKFIIILILLFAFSVINQTQIKAQEYGCSWAEQLGEGNCFFNPDQNQGCPSGYQNPDCDQFDGTSYDTCSGQMHSCQPLPTETPTPSPHPTTPPSYTCPICRPSGPGETCTNYGLIEGTGTCPTGYMCCQPRQTATPTIGPGPGCELSQTGASGNPVCLDPNKSLCSEYPTICCEDTDNCPEPPYENCILNPNQSGPCPSDYPVMCAGTGYCCVSTSDCEPISGVSDYTATDPFCSTRHGDGIDTAIGCIPISSGNVFVEWLFPKLLGIMGGIAFLLMLYGGFLVITSGGNQEKLKAGQETITSAVAGLVFAIFSLFLLQLIGIDILHIPGLIR